MRALLRFRSDNQHLECAAIIFSKHCHVEKKKDGCKKMFIKARCGTLKNAQSLGCCTSSHMHTYVQRGVKKEKKSVPDTLYFTSSSPSAAAAAAVGSEECNAKTNWICRPQSMCSVSQRAKSPPQIPAKSQRFPALSHTYCSVAYLVKPANIRSLLQGPSYPPIL